jgi:hypothetical protein
MIVDRNWPLMVENGAPENILELMQIYPNDLCIQQICCRTLGNLTLYNGMMW